MPRERITSRSARLSEFAHGRGNVRADAIASVAQRVSVQVRVALRCTGLSVSEKFADDWEAKSSSGSVARMGVT